MARAENVLEKEKRQKKKKRHREVEEPKENQVIEARGLKDVP